ncbi:hypothetical protein [Paraburkholderia caribensis]|uniref:hypothetical protein n=1 Tax=Paraburkholderia caribensis TaxID=75105 RepID=UPI00078D875B|nr:hypothetical protein [Paraburkholderia caribensis]AMV44270.1 hypothetical protein ATN79_20210 [Paraburkholderia caribensis]
MTKCDGDVRLNYPEGSRQMRAAELLLMLSEEGITHLSASMKHTHEVRPSYYLTPSVDFAAGESGGGPDQGCPLLDERDRGSTQ